MNKQIRSSNIILTVIGIAGGLIVGICVSDYFYERGLAKERESLIEAAISDIETWQSKDAYPMLHDSISYHTSGKPWPKLTLSGLKELSRNTHSFTHFLEFKTLQALVRECERAALDFNDRIFLRNLSIVAATNVPGLAAEMSPKAYHNFQSNVLPVAISLLKFLDQSKGKLIGDNSGTYFAEDGTMSSYEIISTILTLVGLIGLWVYVHKTTLIAKATKEHNKIITHPAVTVRLYSDAARPWKLDHVWILVENHTSIHAKMRILIEYEVEETEKGVNVKTTTPFKTGDYSGQQVWNIGAKDVFYGHTSLDKLVGRQLKTNETVILNITADVSPFDRENFLYIPPRQYIWKSKTSEWVPSPVPKQ